MKNHAVIDLHARIATVESMILNISAVGIGHTMMGITGYRSNENFWLEWNSYA